MLHEISYLFLMLRDMCNLDMAILWDTFFKSLFATDEVFVKDILAVKRSLMIRFEYVFANIGNFISSIIGLSKIRPLYSIYA